MPFDQAVIAARKNVARHRAAMAELGCSVFEQTTSLPAKTLSVKVTKTTNTTTVSGGNREKFTGEKHERKHVHRSIGVGKRKPKEGYRYVGPDETGRYSYEKVIVMQCDSHIEKSHMKRESKPLYKDVRSSKFRIKFNH